MDEVFDRTDRDPKAGIQGKAQCRGSSCDGCDAQMVAPDAVAESGSRRSSTLPAVCHRKSEQGTGSSGAGPPFGSLSGPDRQYPLPELSGPANYRHYEKALSHGLPGTG